VLKASFFAIFDSSQKILENPGDLKV